MTTAGWTKSCIWTITNDRFGAENCPNLVPPGEVFCDFHTQKVKKMAEPATGEPEK
jgi:hypothetical protein